MKKQRILRKKLTYLILTILLVLIFLLCIFLKFKNSFNIEENTKREFKPYTYYINNSNKMHFKNREILISEESNSMLIGKNQKELKNGYYDIKVDVDENNLVIRINKFQKDDKDFRSVSEEYLEELKLFLSCLLDNNVDEVINIIKQEYIKLRSNMDCATDKNNYILLNVGEYKTNFNIENNILKLDIQM